MNENDRKHFLKKFFSLNASGSVSSTNESFNDEVDSQLAAAAAAAIQTSKNQEQLGVETELGSAEEKSKYIQFIKNNMFINLKGNEPPARPQILISDSNQETQRNESSKLIDDLTTPSPNSATRLLQYEPVYAQKKLNNNNNGAELNCRSLLEQQHSIELRPFRRKEVQIDLKNLRYSQFSCNFDDETMPSVAAKGSNDLLVASPITPVTLSTPLTTYTILTPIRDKVGEIGIADSSQLPFIETSPRYQKLVGNLSLNGVILPQLPFHKFVSIRYRNLGKSGLRVSQFGLGTWVTFGSQISDDSAEEILTTAYHNGINLFDTSEVYANGKAELALGRILKKKGWRRSSYIVCTRLYWGGKAETERGLSRKHIIEGVKASLERLQLEYVDIVFACKPDAATPIEEIVRSFTHLINTEKTFYWGTSRWNAMEIMEAYSVARQFNLIPPICEQAEYHLFQRDEVEMNLPDVNAKIGIGTMTWSPLACGILTGKYDDSIPPNTRAALKGFSWLKDRILNEEGKKKIAKIKDLQLIAEQLNCTMAQLAIAWCLKNETINCVLLGASSVEQLIENIQSLLVVPKLTATLMSDIDRILGNKPMSRQTSKNDVVQKA